jgi:DnaJ family protein C protein 28
MADRERGLDEIIQKAIQEGAFDKLPGKGQPFNWDDSAAVDDDWQLAYHLLKENGYAPDFIETRQVIETDFGEARKALKRTWDWRQKASQSGEDPNLTNSEWAKAKSTFEARVGEINKQISDYNLSIPVQAFYMKTVNAQKEITALIDS